MKGTPVYSKHKRWFPRIIQFRQSSLYYKFSIKGGDRTSQYL